MRLVHLSDLHLGYRQYQRLTPGGVNQREADVAATFRTAIDRVIALRARCRGRRRRHLSHRPPDEPGDPARVPAVLALARRSLPDARHRASSPAITTRRARPRRAAFSSCSRSSACMSSIARRERLSTFPSATSRCSPCPTCPGMELPSFTPDPRRRVTTCSCCTAKCRACCRRRRRRRSRRGRDLARRARRRRAGTTSRSATTTCIARSRRTRSTRGSIDYTSANTWGELYEERVAGAAGQGIHRARSRDRRAHLSPAAAGAPARRSAADQRARTRPRPKSTSAFARRSRRCDGGIDDKIVRLIVRDVPRHVARELDHKAIREYKRRALQLPSRPAAARAAYRLQRRAARRAGGRRSTETRAREAAAPRPLDADIDRDGARRRAPRATSTKREAIAARPPPSARSTAECASIRLQLCNFRQHVDTRIDFDPGITGIIGPNGSGKSTILEAIAWALYGMPAARGTRESIRSYRAAPARSVRVELDFELGGHRYLVVARADATPSSFSTARRAPIANIDHRRHRPAAAPARDEPRRVLQHVLHGTERAERDGGDGAVRARAVPLARARLRAAAHGAGARARAAQLDRRRGDRPAAPACPTRKRCIARSRDAKARV